MLQEKSKVELNNLKTTIHTSHFVIEGTDCDKVLKFYILNAMINLAIFSLPMYHLITVRHTDKIHYRKYHYNDNF